jgi:chromosome segregation ATPase
MKGKLADHEEVISENRKKIHDLKKKCRELETHEFVLEHEVQEAKKEIVPRDAEIVLLKEQLQVGERILVIDCP